MKGKRPARNPKAAIARHLESLLRSMHVVCIHDEEEQEPQPIRRKPIVSVNGRDVKGAA